MHNAGGIAICQMVAEVVVFWMTQDDTLKFSVVQRAYTLLTPPFSLPRPTIPRLKQIDNPFTTPPTRRTQSRASAATAGRVNMRSEEVGGPGRKPRVTTDAFVLLPSSLLQGLVANCGEFSSGCQAQCTDHFVCNMPCHDELHCLYNVQVVQACHDVSSLESLSFCCNRSQP